MRNPLRHIDLEETYQAIEMELDDLATDGILSAAIYNKKTPRRLLLNVINKADRHICETIKLKRHLSIFAAPELTTITYSDKKTSLDIVSVTSPYAMAHDEFSINTQTGGTKIVHSLPEQVEAGTASEKYQTTGGILHRFTVPGKRFYVDTARREIILSEAFDTGKWLRFEAQISAIRFDILKEVEASLDKYEIICPFYCQDWLTERALLELLPRSAIAAASLYDTEANAMREALSRAPGTGNVIIPGDELSGNYEASFEDL